MRGAGDGYVGGTSAPSPHPHPDAASRVAGSPGAASDDRAATGAITPTERDRCSTVDAVRRPPGAWRLAAVVVVTAVAATACDVPNFGAPDPKSTEGESIFSLWQGFFLASIGVAALVWGLIIYSIIRFRRRNDTIPSQKPYNIAVEVVYTAAPVVAVALLFSFSIATEDTATRVDDDPAARVEVVGFQWSWQFAYPDEDVVVTGEPGEPPEMVIPLDEPTVLELVSNDVAHSFWVPDFLSKRDLIPGVENEITVTPTETGTYTGRCAEFCGLDHWRMYFSVRVVPEDDYQAWLDEQRETAAAAADEGGSS
jgi:cytochrome c oxidase subunit II